ASSSEMEQDTKEITVRAINNNERLNSIYSVISALRENVSKIEADHKKYVEQFQRLSYQTEEITKMIGEIQNISEQTNLLSFNASIEAAHAGSVGAGFRIIANEVKKLSDNTKKASEKLLSNVNLLKGSISSLEEETKINSEGLSDLSEEAAKTLEKFDTIKAMNSENNSNVEKISANISQNVQSVNSVIENIRQNEEKTKKDLSLFADCASKNQMLFNDLYSFTYEIKAVLEDLSKVSKPVENTEMFNS
ncbi:MAG: hypothetical protein J6Y93_01710, partial [Treponema sp.]|nr:hypothetical protein [Treponema sp.]